MSGKTVVLIAGIFVVAMLSLLLFNIIILCSGREELDLQFFRYKCGNVPDKTQELNDAFAKACTELKENYNCDVNAIETVTATYAELGKAPRDYTLFELCQLKSMMYTRQYCVGLCKC